MNRLVFVPRPFSLESPTSLLIRTAYKNGFQNVRSFSKALLTEGSTKWLELRLNSGGLCNLLCNEAPIFSDEIRKIFYVRKHQNVSRLSPVLVNGHEISTNLIRNAFRACPHCIKEGYTRPPQDLSIFSECPYHHTTLIVQCPDCGAYNNWYSVNGFRCMCGFNYSTTKNLEPVTPKPFVLPSIFGWKSAIKSINKASADYAIKSQFEIDIPTTSSYSPFTKLVEELLYRELNTYRKLPLTAFASTLSKLTSESLLHHVESILRKHVRSDEICKTQPCCASVRLNFTELCYACHIDSRRARQMINNGEIETHTTPNSNEIYYGSTILCQVIQQELSKQINRSYANPKDLKYVSVSQCASLLTTSTTSIIELIFLGMFPGTIKNSKQYFIPEPAVSEFKSHYIIASEIAQKLQVSNKTITTAMKKLNVFTIIHSTTEWIPSIYFRDEAINILESNSDTIRRYRYRKKSENSLLTGLADELKININSLKALLRFHFKLPSCYSKLSTHQIQRLFAWRETHFTLKEARIKLGVSLPYLNTRFITTGFVDLEKYGPNAFITSKDFLKISKHFTRYCSLAEAAKLLSVSVNTVRTLVRTGMLKTGTPLQFNSQKIIMIDKNSRILNFD